ncbi:hypothetical protein SLS62_006546 [Diatrype stigma]|uniref:Uncharacterized protein n=1 Tax=Diatrype stigma TaxID=117547 RepID=A0AAN9YNY9_9PEZI
MLSSSSGDQIRLTIGRDFDVELESEQLSNLRSIENFTGYGPDQSKVKGRMEIDFLTTSLQWIGEVLNHVANKERHVRMLYDVLDTIAGGLSDELTAIPNDCSTMVRLKTDALIAAIPPMKSRMDATREYLKYLKERSERLSAVLFAMLTHEDAAINLELADSSRRIAEASKHDSSAMKTIAVMTMAFLPATFFAALFAVPSLDWDNDNVIKGNFWVYWAFTLPATALVFLIWISADDRIGLRNLIRRSPAAEKLA